MHEQISDVSAPMFSAYSMDEIINSRKTCIAGKKIRKAKNQNQTPSHKGLIFLITQQLQTFVEERDLLF